MAFSAQFIDYWNKANNETFKRRLAVSMAGKARYWLQNTLSGDSEALKAAKWQFCREVRQRVARDTWLVRWGLYVLHSVDAENVDDDAQLDAVVNAVFWQLTDEALPA